MTIDYGEKERAFIDGLKEATGRDLAAWMGAISAQDLPHRNDVIDWLRLQGFMFSKASWLERIHHNGGKPIYADSAGAGARVRRTRPARRAPQAAPDANEHEPKPAPPASLSSDLEPLLAKAKAYRPLALMLIAQIRAARPSAHFLPRPDFVVVADPDPFAHLGIGPKELRLHLALGGAQFDEVVQKGAPGGGLGKEDALSHMVVLTDARQINERLMDLVGRAAANVNGTGGTIE